MLENILIKRLDVKIVQQINGVQEVCKAVVARAPVAKQWQLEKKRVKRAALGVSAIL